MGTVNADISESPAIRLHPDDNVLIAMSGSVPPPNGQNRRQLHGA